MGEEHVCGAESKWAGGLGLGGDAYFEPGEEGARGAGKRPSVENLGVQKAAESFGAF